MLTSHLSNFFKSTLNLVVTSQGVSSYSFDGIAWISGVSSSSGGQAVAYGNGKFVVSSGEGDATKCSNIYLSDVINIPYVSQTYVKVKDTE